jgi:hypothetical protein
LNSNGRRTSLAGNEKTLSEGPFLIDPLHLASKSCLLCHSHYFLPAVPVRVFRPNGLALLKLNIEIRFPDCYCLVGPRTKIHLNAALLLVVANHVLEL